MSLSSPGTDDLDVSTAVPPRDISAAVLTGWLSLMLLSSVGLTSLAFGWALQGGGNTIPLFRMILCRLS